jgi:MFS transporter, ACS family, tartrate transporter
MALLQQSVACDPGIAKSSGSDAVLQSVIRKAALRFMPLLTIAYLFNYLDRTSSHSSTASAPPVVLSGLR